MTDIRPFDSPPPICLEACPHRQALVSAIEAALDAVDPGVAVNRFVTVRGNRLTVGGHVLDLADIKRIRVLGGGKGAAPMATALNDRLSDRIESGSIAVKAHGRHEVSSIGNIRVFQASHPVPDAVGVEAAAEMRALADDLGEDDLALVLISGGASALLTLPAPPLTLPDLQETTSLLLNAGADIESLNTVRKHLSAIKGGRLGEAIFPARTIALILSDVVGDPIDAIGSGPTAPDTGTFSRALEILQRFNLMERIPERVVSRLKQGAEGQIQETPKIGNPIFARVRNHIIGSNRIAAEAAAEALRSFGISTTLVPKALTGEARDAALEVIAHALPDAQRPSAWVFGGETTVTVKGTGQGGRNQELALAAARHLRHHPHTLIMTLATDGGDGPTDAAGAIATSTTVSRALAKGLSPEAYLDNNDSYAFFSALGDLLRTGPTQTNVADLTVLLKW